MKPQNQTIKQESMQVEHHGEIYDVTVALRWIDGGTQAFRRVILIKNGNSFLYTDGRKGMTVINGEKVLNSAMAHGMFREKRESEREKYGKWWQIGEVLEKVTKSPVGREYEWYANDLNPEINIRISGEMMGSFLCGTKTEEKTYCWLTDKNSVLTDEEQQRFVEAAQIVTEIMGNVYFRQIEIVSTYIKREYGVEWEMPMDD